MKLSARNQLNGRLVGAHRGATTARMFGDVVVAR
jgi:molybdopterin-binding protein